MRLLTLIMLTLLMAACRPSIKSSSENYVTVESYQMDQVKAQEAADAECAKYHRRATLTVKPTPGEDERDYIFGCID